MAETVNVREIVLHMLLEVTRDGKASTQVLTDWLAKYQYLSKQDRSQISRLMRTTLENMIFIDTVLNHYASVKVTKMKPVVRTILRMGTAQMLYMDGVPDYAVCSASVDLAARKGFKGLGGFVNGVLRTVARNKDSLTALIPDAHKNPVRYLSVRYSAPEWLSSLWLEHYGFDAAEKMFKASVDETVTTIRVNTLKTSAEALKISLKQQGIDVRDGAYVPFVLKISGYDHLASIDGFESGQFMVQDESSVLAGLCAGFTSEMKVVDICGAPGGKSMNAAMIMHDRGTVLCRDVSPVKLERIRENAERLGITCVTAQQWDGAVPDETLMNSADVVIADVPCSGLGVIGKKTDIKYNMSPEGMASLVQLQRQILDQAWRYVRPGGVLLYSTCTVNPEENQGQVRYLTQNYPLKTESLDAFLPEKLHSETTKAGWLQLLPGIHGCDGFFIARLKKEAADHDHAETAPMKTDIKSLMPEDLEKFVTETLGEQKFRARQLYAWMHKKLVRDFSRMSNISGVLQAKLERCATMMPVTIAQRLISEIDGTRKYLFRLWDGNVIESVWMQYKHGNSVCISSQVGCRMGCRFCASTIDGLERNLTAGEMLSQIYEIQKDTGERVSNIVIMGSGEPLDNYDQVVRFLRMISDEKGLNISQRNITLSTCGLAPKIYELADENLQVTLAISLHAVNDARRSELMPVAKKYSIEEILQACRYYYSKNNRRLTFEYSLVKGVNDSPQEAKELARRLDGLNCHINLIPVNPVKERHFKQSDADSVQKFKNNLEKCGKNVTIRREMGRDIQAACGQLRKSYMDKIQKEG